MSKQPINPTMPAQTGPLARFFKSYSKFRYNPSRRTYGWKRGDQEGETAWLAFRLAIVKEFNYLFGTDPYDLLAWQNLCAMVGIKSRHLTREECIGVRLACCLSHPQQRFLITVINFIAVKGSIFQYHGHGGLSPRGTGVAPVFDTKEALWNHVVKTSSYFPHHPKAGELLRWLRRKPIVRMKNSPLFSPSSTHDNDKRAKSKDKGVESKAKNSMLSTLPQCKKNMTGAAITEDIDVAAQVDSNSSSE